MRPGVAGRAEFLVRRAVGVGEVERVGHAHRAVVVRRRHGDRELARLAVQLRRTAGRLISPRAGFSRAEAHAVDAIAVVESRHFDWRRHPARKRAAKRTSRNGLPLVGPWRVTSYIPHCSTAVPETPETQPQRRAQRRRRSTRECGHFHRLAFTAQVRLRHFVFNFNTVTEYGGNSRAKLAPKPSTFSVRGTTLFGSSMELVSSRLLAARTTASPLALIVSRR